MLYIVSSPIGNLSDLTLRALNILFEVDIILCEDTRVTRKLLNHHNVTGKELISFHQHTSQHKLAKLLPLVEQNKVALVSDGGTPGVSDPGVKLIACLYKYNKNIKIVPIPGPSAVLAALCVAGFSADKFIFLGFVPHKKGRKKILEQILESSITVVFFESPHRIVKCLTELNKLISQNKDKHFVVCRELTKKFESIYRGTLQQVLAQVSADPIKGEYTVVVSGRD